MINRGTFGRIICDGDCENCEHPLECTRADKVEYLIGKNIDIIVEEFIGSIPKYTEYSGVIEYISVGFKRDFSKLEIQLSLNSKMSEANLVYLTIGSLNKSSAIIVIRNDSLLLPLPVNNNTYKAFRGFSSNEVFKVFESLDEYSLYLNSFNNIKTMKEEENNMVDMRKKQDYCMNHGVTDDEEAEKKTHYTEYGGTDNYEDEGPFACFDDNEDDESDYNMDDEETFSAEVVGLAFVLGIGVTLGVAAIAKVVKFMSRK